MRKPRIEIKEKSAKDQYKKAEENRQKIKKSISEIQKDLLIPKEVTIKNTLKPNEIIKGAVQYITDGGKAEVCLVGMEDKVKEIIKENNYSLKGLTFLNATEVITCEEAPTEAVRKKPDSSIVVSM